MSVTQKTRRLFVFPSISHLEGIGQGGISREISPWYFPDNTGANAFSFQNTVDPAYGIKSLLLSPMSDRSSDNNRFAF